MPLSNTGIQKAESLRIIKFRFWLVHLASLAVLFVPYDNSLLTLTAVTFFARTFGWEAGSHRYFSHRSFKTSRTFQLFLALLAASGGQRGPIWWATRHRAHHRYSDTSLDPHSPVYQGFGYAHMGWFMDPENIDTDLDAAKDLSRFPELVWVNKYHYFFPYLLMAVIFCLGEFTTILGARVSGVSAVIWGFFFSTMLSLQATFVVNTITHGLKPGFFSSRRFNTDDTSTNNWLLAIPTMGASWHNNHHRFMGAAKAGFYWWEFDLTYYLLKFLSWFGIVWGLQAVPKKILEEGMDSNRARKSVREDTW